MDNSFEMNFLVQVKGLDAMSATLFFGSVQWWRDVRPLTKDRENFQRLDCTLNAILIMNSISESNGQKGA